MATRTRWFIKECCFSDECTKQSWARVRQCQSFESADDSIQKMMQHITSSSLHWHHADDEELEMTVHGRCVVMEEQVPEAWFDDAIPAGAAQPKTPPFVLAPSPSAAPPVKMASQSAASSAPPVKPQSTTSKKPSVAPPAKRASPPTAPPPKRAPTREAASGNNLARAIAGALGPKLAKLTQGAEELKKKVDEHMATSSASSSSVVQAEPMVTVPRSLLQQVAHSVEKSLIAVQHAAKISDQAHLAFVEESRRLEDVKRDLRDTMSR